ncbi:MAG: DUF4923 family protein [Bacteroides sp.]|nr:DUF4923 family protein [Bacteroides sp.]
MKRIFTILFAAVVMMTGSQASAQFNLGNILGKVTGNQETTAESNDSTGSAAANTGSGLGGLIKGVTDAIGLTSSDVDVKDMVGTWSYSGPAVVFKSDNLLLKAGGAAASATVENKLKDYYKIAGFESLKLTIESDSTFTFKVKSIPLQGTITRNTETGNFYFTFKAFKKISLGKMEAYVSISGGKTMSLTFDVSGLLKIVEKAGSITGNSTLKGVTELLNQYEGLTAGWKLTKTADTQK